MGQRRGNHRAPGKLREPIAGSEASFFRDKVLAAADPQGRDGWYFTAIDFRTGRTV